MVFADGTANGEGLAAKTFLWLKEASGEQKRELWDGGFLEDSEGRGKLLCTKHYLFRTCSHRISLQIQNF